MAGFTITSCAVSDVGKRRRENQDSVLEVFIPGHNGSDATRLFIVADGMGGHADGLIASQAAVASMTAAVFVGFPIRDAARKAAHAVFAKNALRKPERRMGTTLTALSMQGGVARRIHAGDSRIYLLENARLQQITTDHVLWHDLIMIKRAYRHDDRGMIAACRECGIRDKIAVDLPFVTEDEVMSMWGSILTSSVGLYPSVDFETGANRLARGQRYVLCSDGLTRHVSDAQIEDVVSRYAPDNATNLLLQAALDGGGFDNISVIVVAVD